MLERFALLLSCWRSKSRFEATPNRELVRKAREDGPQAITVHGSDAAVVMSAEQYAKLARRKGT